MNEPRYQFWRPIQPVEGQPIPDGAEWSTTDAPDCWDSHYEYWDDTAFTNEDLRYNWRVPVEVVPIDVAVNLILQNSEPTVEGASDGQVRVTIARELHVDTLPALRELVIAKLRELSQEKTDA